MANIREKEEDNTKEQEEGLSLPQEKDKDLASHQTPNSSSLTYYPDILPPFSMEIKVEEYTGKDQKEKKEKEKENDKKGYYTLEFIFKKTNEVREKKQKPRNETADQYKETPSSSKKPKTYSQKYNPEEYNNH